MWGTMKTMTSKTPITRGRKYTHKERGGVYIVNSVGNREAELFCEENGLTYLVNNPSQEYVDISEKTVGKVKMASFKNKLTGNNAIKFLETAIEKIQKDELSCMGLFFLEDNEERNYQTYFCVKNGNLEILGLIDMLKDSVIFDLNNGGVNGDM